ncbi:uncharacterized protein LOC100370134 [Saccoglossus kowalevskii]
MVSHHGYGTRAGSYINNSTQERIRAEHVYDIQVENSTIREISQHNPITPSQPLGNSSMVPNESPQRRYLLPLFFTEGGPNWLYNSFRISVRLALYQQRSIVLLPFHKHFVTQKDTSSRIRNFNDTFDLEKLRQLLPLATTDEFQRECGDNLTADDVILSRLFRKPRSNIQYLKEGYAKHVDLFRSMFGLVLPNAEDVWDSTYNVSARISTSPNSRCLIVSSPWELRHMELPNGEELYRRVDKHFVRAPYIVSAANLLSRQICDGGKFAVLHWRNRTGETGCRPGDNSDEHCRSVLARLGSMYKYAGVIVQSLTESMKSRGLECLYVAYPLYDQAILPLLGKSTRLYTRDDIIPPSSDIAEYKEDNYVWSLIEQEFARKAKLFFACAKSNWSQLVKHGRLEETINVKDLPGLPSNVRMMVR